MLEELSYWRIILYNIVFSGKNKIISLSYIWVWKKATEKIVSEFVGFQGKKYVFKRKKKMVLS